MSEMEIAKLLGNKAKAGIICMVLLVFAFMFLPLYQIGVANTYEELIRTSEKNINELENKIRQIEGDIAVARMPEYLIDRASFEKLSFESIDSASTVRIARGN